MQSKARLLDSRLIPNLEILREYFGKPITINNWYDGGNYSESGFRHHATKTGSSYSQHKFGRAVDIKVEGMDPGTVKEEILRIQHKLDFTRMEHPDYATTWTHLDLAYSTKGGIHVFKP
jgi:hypothetical protein